MAWWKWLKSKLENALRADDSEYIVVSASDVMKRNKKGQRSTPPNLS